VSSSIVVLGCGPAGVAAAIGLRRLGYTVTVIGEPRDYPVMEGISARVCESLYKNGLRHALQCASQPVRRYAIWNGEVRDTNTEALIYRPDFDAALLDDLHDADVPVLKLRINSLQQQGNDYSVDCGAGDKRSEVDAEFVVDARGRSAKLASRSRLRGSETVSLGMNWLSDKDHPFTAAASIEQGWMWMARNTQGRLFVQLTTNAKNPLLPTKPDIPDLIVQQLQQIELPAGISLHNREPMGEALARSSTPVLVQQPLADNYLRVGDAAMAVDPLSGNGIFQSLSSALIAPAVINTLLQRPANASLAGDFYRERLENLFFRFARIGRDFYQLEERWQDSAFWQPRRMWPDALPAHAEQDRVLGRALRPVVNHGIIERKMVLLTEDQPMGIWQADSKIQDQVEG
jgi:flavin-dependent dehydrogenase